MASQLEETKPPFKDYYQILQLHPETDAAMVDQAYWYLARLYNAATSSDPLAKAKLDDLNEAYSVLRSPARRAAYDAARDVALGKGALPMPPRPEPEPPPLAVMEKQRPRSREDAGPERPRRLRLNFGRLSVFAWQRAVGSLIILALASTALATGAHSALVVALLVLGVALISLPLVGKLVRLPALPTLRRLTIRMPRLSDQRLAHPTLDPDALRQSTQAIRTRWQENTDADEAIWPGITSESYPPEEFSETPNDEGSRA